MPIAEITGQVQEPIQGIFFSVEIDGIRLGFAECGGLSAEFDVVKYREGTDQNLTQRVYTGLITYERLKLKRAWTQDTYFDTWWAERAIVGPKAVNRRRVGMVHVMDRNLKIIKTHSFIQGVLVKHELDDVVAGDSKLIMQTSEIEHEGCFPTPAGTFRAAPIGG